MSRLRVLLLQHCQLDIVSDITLPNSQTLDVLDMSSGGIIDLGCLLVRVNVFNLTKTIIQYPEDYSKTCWNGVSHVISDQTGFCCLHFFEDRCNAGWEIERGTCPSLLRSQTLLLYCCILVMVIVLCNCCVFIFNLLTKSKDAMLICNLSLANFFIVIPLYTFISWHVSHDTEFAFFEPFLSKSIHCRVSGDILVVCTPLATFFQMLISLQKYCGIVCRRSILSGTQPLVYFVITAVWITSVFACTLLRVQDMDDTQITTILKGLFLYYRLKYPILLVFSVFNMIFVLVSIFAYGLIMKNIHKNSIHRSQTWQRFQSVQHYQDDVDHGFGDCFCCGHRLYQYMVIPGHNRFVANHVPNRCYSSSAIGVEPFSLHFDYPTVYQRLQTRRVICEKDPSFAHC